MTISKGANLSVIAGTGGTPSVAAFNATEAGVAYIGTVTSQASGFLLSISGTTVTTAGAEATLDTATNAPFQRVQLVPSSSTKLRMLTVDSGSPNDAIVHIVPITKTATALVGGTPQVLTFPADVDDSFINAAYNWNGDTLVIVLRDAAPVAFYITLADDTTQGNVVTLAPATAPLGNIPTFAPFSSTAGILLYKESTSLDWMGVSLTRSGSTLTLGTPFTLDTNNVAAGTSTFGAAQISSGFALIGNIDTGGDRRYEVITSGLVEGTLLEILGADSITWCERFHDGSMLIFSDDLLGTARWTEVTVSGTTLTQTNEVTASSTSNSTFRGTMTRLDNSRILTILGDTTVVVAVISTNVAPPGISDNEFTLPTIAAKIADVDADGTYIYIAAIASDTTPILIKFATALNADGVVTFEPAGGTNIGVMCGRFDADVIWIAGDFNSTNAVEKSENGGTSFTVKDPGTFGSVSAFIVGPDSDERVLIFDSADGEISETTDDGVSWSQKRTGLAYDTLAVDRLDVNTDEIVMGNVSGVNLVNYSINVGVDLANFTLTLPTGQNINGIIIN